MSGGLCVLVHCGNYSLRAQDWKLLMQFANGVLRAVDCPVLRHSGNRNARPRSSLAAMMGPVPLACLCLPGRTQEEDWGSRLAGWASERLWCVVWVWA